MSIFYSINYLFPIKLFIRILLSLLEIESKRRYARLWSICLKQTRILFFNRVKLSVYKQSSKLFLSKLRKNLLLVVLLGRQEGFCIFESSKTHEIFWFFRFPHLGLPSIFKDPHFLSRVYLILFQNFCDHELTYVKFSSCLAFTHFIFMIKSLFKLVDLFLSHFLRYRTTILLSLCWRMFKTVQNTIYSALK